MIRELAENFRPVAPPQLIDEAYTPDQHARLLQVVRDNGPWPLILAENFKTPEEVIATVSGSIPEGVKLTWDMIGLNPVFRGYLARGGTCFYPEIEDCYYNSRFLELVRNYWGCQYAEPETFLFNIQGPTPIGGPPHLDGTVFRGMTMENTPLWLLLTMANGMSVVLCLAVYCFAIFGLAKVEANLDSGLLDTAIKLPRSRHQSRGGPALQSRTSSSAYKPEYPNKAE